jgi:hypothetical protein
MTFLGSKISERFFVFIYQKPTLLSSRLLIGLQHAKVGPLENQAVMNEIS